jgi:hypothetical protein
MDLSSIIEPTISMSVTLIFYLVHEFYKHIFQLVDFIENH